MPQGATSLRMKFKVDDASGRGDPNERLPTASTCSFNLHLPAYTEAEALKEKLRYAMNHGRTIDLDRERGDATAWEAGGGDLEPDDDED